MSIFDSPLKSYRRVPGETWLDRVSREEPMPVLEDPVPVEDWRDERIRDLEEECFRLREELTFLRGRPRPPKRERVMSGREAQAIIDSLKTPCIECGRTPIHFHHRDPKLKVVEVSAMRDGTYTEEDIRAEVAQCDCLCPTCHAQRHRS